MAHDLNKLLKVLTKIGSAEQLHTVYEAGPTGLGLQRALKERGYLCEIIAPSQIPRRPGDRVKPMDVTAFNWPSAPAPASSVRCAYPSLATERSATWRAREVNSRVQARHQLKGFLLRHDIRYPGKTSWSIAYYRWLSTLNLDAGATQTAFTE